jgi:hypothetical protein
MLRGLTKSFLKKLRAVMIIYGRLVTNLAVSNESIAYFYTS